MKTMTCRQLGGACDLGFRAESFEEMAELSKHVNAIGDRTCDGTYVPALDHGSGCDVRRRAPGGKGSVTLARAVTSA